MNGKVSLIQWHKIKCEPISKFILMKWMSEGSKNFI